MSEVPEDLRYTSSHEWVRSEEDGTATVGITDHAQEALGDLVFVEPPEVGTVLDVEEACAVVESVKAASDIYAPVSGEVIEANDTLSETPEVLNSDPYGDGWIMRIRLDDPSQLEGLLSAEDYRALVAEEE